MISAGETKPWITNLDGRALGLEVILLKEVFVLPWNQFLYAHGGDDEVWAVFTTHDVVAKGSGLASLLSDLAAQQVTTLQSQRGRNGLHMPLLRA